MIYIVRDAFPSIGDAYIVLRCECRILGHAIVRGNRVRAIAQVVILANASVTHGYVAILPEVVRITPTLFTRPTLQAFEQECLAMERMNFERGKIRPEFCRPGISLASGPSLTRIDATSSEAIEQAAQPIIDRQIDHVIAESEVTR